MDYSNVAYNAGKKQGLYIAYKLLEDNKHISLDLLLLLDLQNQLKEEITKIDTQ